MNRRNMRSRARADVKKPNGFLYFLVFVLFFPFLKIFFRLRVNRTGYVPPDGPMIVVSNHQSFMDFLLAMLSFYPRRLNAVAAQKFFFYRPLNTLLPLMGCIPKKLFDPDTRSIMGMLSVLRRGGRVLLFPEGRCSVDGEYTGIHKSTGKLVNRFGVPVVACRIEGSYICMPFWRKGFRFGRLRVTFSNLFSAEEAAMLTVDEINRRIDRRLGGWDSAPPKKPFQVFSARRLAEGLEHIVYWCPKCGREFALNSCGNVIRCGGCGVEAKMNRTAKLSFSSGGDMPGSVHEWYRLQAVHESELLKDGDPLITAVTVRMPVREGEGVEPCGSGTLSLSSDGWRYEGELKGEKCSMFFPLATVSAIPFDPNDDFQIYARGDFYMFTPDNASASSKYATAGEAAYWRFVPSGQMTPGFDSGFPL